VSRATIAPLHPPAPLAQSKPFPLPPCAKEMLFSQLISSLHFPLIMIWSRASCPGPVKPELHPGQSWPELVAPQRAKGQTILCCGRLGVQRLSLPPRPLFSVGVTSQMGLFCSVCTSLAAASLLLLCRGTSCLWRGGLGGTRSPRLCLTCGGEGTPRGDVAESEKESPKPGTPPESSGSSSRVIFVALWMKTKRVVFHPQPETSWRADPHSSSLVSRGGALGPSQGQQVNPVKQQACFQPRWLPRGVEMC